MNARGRMPIKLYALMLKCDCCIISTCPKIACFLCFIFQPHEIVKSILTSWALPNKHAAGRIWSVRYSWPALGFRSGFAFTEQQNLPQKRQGHNDSELEVENTNVSLERYAITVLVKSNRLGKLWKAQNLGHRDDGSG